jgi:hypothetical protein
VSAAASGLHEYDGLPSGFLEAAATDLHRVLPGPSLLHLPGERPEALFVAVLQHGDETTGLLAVQRLLRAYGKRPLPRCLSLFVGNVAAARVGQRRLAQQLDYNRAWPGSEAPLASEHRLMASVFEAMRKRPLFASVDLHNTTGANPPHAAVHALDAPSLHLARSYAATVLYVTRPRGLQAQAFAALAPAVTVECGRAGEPEGVAHAARCLQRGLELEHLPATRPGPDDPALYQSAARLEIAPDVRFDFQSPPLPATLELVLRPDLERFNFEEVPAGTLLGHARGDRWPVRALAAHGTDAASALLACSDGELRLTRRLMPVLLTTQRTAVRQDCLGYLMARDHTGGR